MEHFTKTACVIDTSSIINLDNVTLGGKDVLLYVRRFFDVRVSDTIREELDRNSNLVSSRESTYWPPFLHSKSFAPQVLTDDKSCIEPFYSSPPLFDEGHNAGEYGNARVALELLLTRQIGHTVFVTDDENACNGFLRTMQGAFPGVRLWTSVDIILYLGSILLKEGKASFEQVRAALRDVYATGLRMKPLDEITEAEKASIIRKQANSINQLKLVYRTIKHWRN